MIELSSVDRSTVPPKVTIPRRYNAAHDLIDRNLQGQRADKLAYIDDEGSYTYKDLAQRVDQWAAALRSLGVEPEQRVLLCLTDTIDFPTVFLGCIKAGVIPVAVNTMLRTEDYEYLLADSRAKLVVVSVTLYPLLEPAIKRSCVRQIVLSRGASPGTLSLTQLLDAAPRQAVAPHDTCADEPCFWLYSSGSTGMPKEPSMHTPA